MRIEPPLNYYQYPTPRLAVLDLLWWLKKYEKPVTTAFIVEWFELKDHSTISSILKALTEEMILKANQIKRAGKSKTTYILVRRDDPTVPVMPTKSDMIWGVFQNATKPVTVAEIAVITGVNKETVSSFVQRLSRSGFIESKGASVGGLRSGHRNFWKIKNKYKGAQTPKAKKIDGKNMAVLTDD